MSTTELIPAALLVNIRELRLKADGAQAQAQIAELQFRTACQLLYLELGLRPKDEIDIATGALRRSPLPAICDDDPRHPLRQIARAWGQPEPTDQEIKLYRESIAAQHTDSAADVTHQPS